MIIEPLETTVLPLGSTIVVPLAELVDVVVGVVAELLLGVVEEGVKVKVCPSVVTVVGSEI